MKTSVVDVVSPDEISGLYAKICSVTTKYTFTHPVEDADLDIVHKEILALLPEEATVGVNATARRDFVGINVRMRGVRIYQRLMRVMGRLDVS